MNNVIIKLQLNTQKKITNLIKLSSRVFDYQIVPEVEINRHSKFL